MFSVRAGNMSWHEWRCENWVVCAMSSGCQLKCCQWGLHDSPTVVKKEGLNHCQCECTCSLSGHVYIFNMLDDVFQGFTLCAGSGKDEFACEPVDIFKKCKMASFSFYCWSTCAVHWPTICLNYVTSFLRRKKKKRERSQSSSSSSSSSSIDREEEAEMKAESFVKARLGFREPFERGRLRGGFVSSFFF